MTPLLFSAAFHFSILSSLKNPALNEGEARESKVK